MGSTTCADCGFDRTSALGEAIDVVEGASDRSFTICADGQGEAVDEPRVDKLSSEACIRRHAHEVAHHAGDAMVDLAARQDQP